MPSIARTVVALTLGGAMLVGQPTQLALTPAPAEAKERCGYDSNGRWRCRDRDGIDTKDIVIGAAVIAGIAAVASAIAKNAKDDYERGRGWGYDDGRNATRSAAIDACTRAAEDEARRYGSHARVREINDVDRDGSRFRVRGTVEIERGFDGWDNRGWDDRGWDDRNRRYEGASRERARFTCTAQYGRVTAFRFNDGFDYAYNL